MTEEEAHCLRISKVGDQAFAALADDAGKTTTVDAEFLVYGMFSAVCRISGQDARTLADRFVAAVESEKGPDH